MTRAVQPTTFEEFRDADRWYRDYARASAKAAQARGSLDAGASRARVTTANARWSRAAEARDRREDDLRNEWAAGRALAAKEQEE